MPSPIVHSADWCSQWLHFSSCLRSLQTGHLDRVPPLHENGCYYAGPVPYDLRHSLASLLLHEGRSVIYVARQLGHSAQLTMRTYGHVIEELDEAPRITAEDAFAAARSEEKFGRKFGRTE